MLENALGVVHKRAVQLSVQKIKILHTDKLAINWQILLKFDFSSICFYNMAYKLI